MYIGLVQYSNQTVPAVSVLVRPDGCAEYRMRKDAETIEDGEGLSVLQAKEVYFEVSAGQPQPTMQEVLADFEAYWESGSAWTGVEPVDSLEQVRADVDYIAMETGVDI